VLEQIAPQSMFRMYEIPLFYNAHPNRDWQLRRGNAKKKEVKERADCVFLLPHAL
jgi:hypothetical protein